MMMGTGIFRRLQKSPKKLPSPKYLYRIGCEKNESGKKKAKSMACFVIVFFIIVVFAAGMLFRQYIDRQAADARFDSMAGESKVVCETYRRMNGKL